MNNKKLIYALLLPAMFVLTSSHVSAQESGRTYQEEARVDSLAQAYKQQERVEDQRKQDSRELSNLKSEKRETKAKAREAQRIGAEANSAARESKTAYRKEKKAQKARLQADKQSKKAAKARAISDEN